MSHRRRSLENGLWNALWQSLGDGKACGTRRRRRRMWKARHRRLGGEQLEKRELLAVYDSFNVSSLGGTVNSARILEAYTDYTVNVSGFVYIQNAQSRLADAEYFEVWDSVNKRKTGAWADSSSISGLDIGVRLSQVNNATKWGPRKADGNYSQTVAGIGQPLQAKFVDAPYTDNSGQFSVKVHTYVPVSVAAYDPVAKEEGRDPGTFRITRGGSARYPLTVSFRLSGTSSDGDADYTSSATTVTFGEWESEVDVTITPIDDPTIETSEAVTLTLDSSEKYDVVPTSASAIVTIEDNDNKPPVAVDDSFALLAGTSYAIAVGDLLANDFDPDDAPSPLDVIRAADAAPAVANGPVSGTLNWIAELQKLVYTPNEGFVGSDSFTYRVTDSLLESNLATVTLDVRVDETAVTVDLDYGHRLTVGEPNFVEMTSDLTAVYAVDVPFLVTASLATGASSSATVRVYANAGQAAIGSFQIAPGQVESVRFSLPSVRDGVVLSSVGLVAVVVDSLAGQPIAQAQEEEGMRYVQLNPFGQALSVSSEVARAYAASELEPALENWLKGIVSPEDEAAALETLRSMNPLMAEHQIRGLYDANFNLLSAKLLEGGQELMGESIESLLATAKPDAAIAVGENNPFLPAIEQLADLLPDIKQHGVGVLPEGPQLVPEDRLPGLISIDFAAPKDVALNVGKAGLQRFLATGDKPTMDSILADLRSESFVQSIRLNIPLKTAEDSPAIGQFTVGISNVSFDRLLGAEQSGSLSIFRGTPILGSTAVIDEFDMQLIRRQTGPGGDDATAILNAVLRQ